MKRMSIILVLLLVVALNAFAIEPANNRESKNVLELLDDDKEEFDWVKIPTFEELYKLPESDTESDVFTEQVERIIDKTNKVIEKFLDSILKIFEEDEYDYE